MVVEGGVEVVHGDTGVAHAAVKGGHHLALVDFFTVQIRDCLQAHLGLVLALGKLTVFKRWGDRKRKGSVIKVYGRKLLLKHMERKSWV